MVDKARASVKIALLSLAKAKTVILFHPLVKTNGNEKNSMIFSQLSGKIKEIITPAYSLPLVLTNGIMVNKARASAKTVIYPIR